MAQEESMESNDVTQIIKGKRTKRQRSSSPYKVGLTSSSSSGGGEGGRGRGVVVEEYGCSSPTTSSATRDQVCESTEEEEYMANCLILLAQGDGPRPIDEKSIMEKFSGQKFSAMATPNITKAGFYVYQCKTCNRSFPSFQALGGHRASHKRPKAVAEEKKPPVVVASMDDHEDCQLNKSCSDFMISLETPNSKGFHHGAKAKVHECSICGSEFTSGQALGGHMRRHRAAGTTTNKVDSSLDNTSIPTIKSNVIGDHDHHQMKPRRTLALDLNLPAPEDDHHHRESKFQLLSTQQVLVFSAPALVDCHY